MRIIVLPVGRCRFLEENESGLRFQRNKIWWFTECTTPYNRPSYQWLEISSTVKCLIPNHIFGGKFRMNVQKLSGWWLRQIPRSPSGEHESSESHFLGTSNVLEICTFTYLICDLNNPLLWQSDNFQSVWSQSTVYSLVGYGHFFCSNQKCLFSFAFNTKKNHKSLHWNRLMKQ